MDINKLLGGIQCDCGRHHTCDIEYVYIESGAIKHLSEVCAAYRYILLVGDENTFAAAGERVLSALAGLIFFREKPDKISLIGIILAFAATFLFLF